MEKIHEGQEEKVNKEILVKRKTVYILYTVKYTKISAVGGITMHKLKQNNPCFSFLLIPVIVMLQSHLQVSSFSSSSVVQIYNRFAAKLLPSSGKNL